MMKETSMTEQRYRVIADRDKGDEPGWEDIDTGDRYVMERETSTLSRIVRIERPVPNTAVWRDKHGDEWVEDAGGLMHSFETAPFPREHVEKKWGPLMPVGSPPSVPTREQIIDAITCGNPNGPLDYEVEHADRVVALLAAHRPPLPTRDQIADAIATVDAPWLAGRDYLRPTVQNYAAADAVLALLQKCGDR